MKTRPVHKRNRLSYTNTGHKGPYAWCCTPTGTGHLWLPPTHLLAHTIDSEMPCGGYLLGDARCRFAGEAFKRGEYSEGAWGGG